MVTKDTLADVDFWIESTDENFKNLISVFKEMEFEINDFPTDVKRMRQNISIKFSPISLNIELITNFSSTMIFNEVYKRSKLVEIENISWRVLCYEDLIESKLIAARPKDLLDIQELERLRGAIE